MRRRLAPPRRRKRRAAPTKDAVPPRRRPQSTRRPPANSTSDSSRRMPPSGASFCSTSMSSLRFRSGSSVFRAIRPSASGWKRRRSPAPATTLPNTSRRRCSFRASRRDASCATISASRSRWRARRSACPETCSIGSSSSSILRLVIRSNASMPSPRSMTRCRLRRPPAWLRSGRRCKAANALG